MFVILYWNFGSNCILWPIRVQFDLGHHQTELKQQVDSFGRRTQQIVDWTLDSVPSFFHYYPGVWMSQWYCFEGTALIQFLISPDGAGETTTWNSGELLLENAELDGSVIWSLKAASLSYLQQISGNFTPLQIGLPSSLLFLLFAATLQKPRFWCFANV